MTRKIKDLPVRHQLAVERLVSRGKPLGIARANALREVEIVMSAKRRAKA